MNPFLMLQHELDKDNSRDDYAILLRCLLPFWAAEWDDHALNYANAYTMVAQKVSTAVPASALKDKTLKFVTGLANRRTTPVFSAGY